MYYPVRIYSGVAPGAIYHVATVIFTVLRSILATNYRLQFVNCIKSWSPFIKKYKNYHKPAKLWLVQNETTFLRHGFYAII